MISWPGLTCIEFWGVTILSPNGGENPAAGGKFSGFDLLKYSIFFTKMYFDTSNCKKNPPAAGYFHAWFALQKCSSETEIPKIFRLRRATLPHSSNLDTGLDWLLCPSLPHEQRDNRFLNSMGVFCASWNAGGAHQSCMTREWVLPLVEAPSAPRKTLRTAPVRRIGCLANNDRESVQQKTFVFDQAWPTRGTNCFVKPKTPLKHMDF